MRRFQGMTAGSLCLGLAMATTGAIRSQERASTNEWRYFGGNKAFTR